VAANVKNTNANHTFIAYTGDPHSYHDALCTPHSKELEKALEDEYDQLMRTGTFKWLKNVPPCKGNLTNLRRELHLSLAKGNPK
jgi:hypothetical protein